MTNTSLSRAAAERPVDGLPTGASRSSALEVSGATCSCSLSSLIRCQNTPDNAPKHVCFRREQETGLSLFYPIEIADRSAAQVPQGNQQHLFFALVCNKFPVTEKKPVGDRFRRTASTTRKSVETTVVAPGPECLRPSAKPRYYSPHLQRWSGNPHA
jgi:hypothetical protein